MMCGIQGAGKSTFVRERFFETHVRISRDLLRTVGYWLDVRPNEAIARNAARSGRTRIPVPAILGTYKRLEVPRQDEGFAEVWRVEALPDGFVVAPLPADLPA